MTNNKFWIFLILISFFSCRKNLDQVSWDTDILTPIAFADLSNNNIVEGQNDVSYNSEGLAFLTFDEKLFSFNPLDTLMLDVDPFLRELTLESLELEDQTFTNSILMGDIIREEGLDVFIKDDSEVPSSFIDGFPPIVPDEPITLDISQYFERAVLSQGFLTVGIDNQFPVNIDNIDFEIRNAVQGNVLYTKSFVNIASKTSVTETVDLYQSIGDTAIEGVLEIFVTNMTISAPPGPTIFIDYQDYIEFTLSLTDLKVQSAKAIFPEQNVIDFTGEVELQDMGDVELKSALIDSGYVLVNVRSSIETDLFLDYFIPSATVNGEPFEFSEMIEAAPTGGVSQVSKQYPVKGFQFDLTGNDGLKVNAFVNKVVAKIKPTSEPVDVGLDDTVFVEISVIALTASQIEGYVGQTTFQFGPEKIKFSLFNDLDFSLLNFKEVKASIDVDNGIGITGNGNINLLEGANTTTSAVYNAGVFTNINFNSASGNAKNPTIQTTSIDIPDAQNLVNIHPDEVSYDVSFALNPDGNTSAYSNFANKDNPIEGKFHVEVPLDIQIENLQLVDTFSFVNEDLTFAENINSSSLILNIENDYPLSATAKLYFLDRNDIAIDSLILPNTIEASSLGTNGKTVGSMSYRHQEKISSSRLNKILNTSNIRLVVNFNTSPSERHVKFYQDYLFRVNISSDLNLTVQNKL